MKHQTAWLSFCWDPMQSLLSILPYSFPTHVELLHACLHPVTTGYSLLCHDRGTTISLRSRLSSVLQPSNNLSVDILASTCT